ncbi:MAG: potassium-transporting ATPase subunit KdpC, partial [Candidatus Binataceae bacterium]
MRLWTACKMTLVMTLLTGIIYPCVMVGLAEALFPYQAHGSLIEQNGQVVGSRLIGQNFNSPGYFHPRPSAAGDKGYDAASSGGSNLGPTNKVLIAEVRQRLARVLEKNPGVSARQVPIGLVTASGSGLDPEISPAAAAIQIARIAKVRDLPINTLRKLV